MLNQCLGFISNPVSAVEVDPNYAIFPTLPATINGTLRTFPNTAATITLNPPHGNITAWSGFQVDAFETPGIISVTIKIFSVVPLYPYASNSTIYSTTVTFPDLSIASGLESQQQTNENQNLSLTFFVLFFACVDITVVFYDHSEKKRYRDDYE
jgi:hypothetical protein